MTRLSKLVSVVVPSNVDEDAYLADYFNTTTVLEKHIVQKHRVYKRLQNKLVVSVKLVPKPVLESNDPKTE